jgi:methylmalonyl-CoA mutase
MNLHFEEFPTINHDTWKQQIAKELKKDFNNETFQHIDTIEGLTFSILPENAPTIHVSTEKENNDWAVGYSIQVNDLNVEEANKEGLQVLNFGANSLTFVLQTDKHIDLSKLLKDVSFEYIDIHFNTQNNEQADYIHDFFKTKKHQQVFINSMNNWTGSGYVSSYDLHNCGGNAQQEIAFILCELNNKLSQGNVETIHIELGIGANFMLEITKFKAIRVLSQQLFNHYQVSPKLYVTAKTGFINKSSKDPHTNLLRQTTEAFSAILGDIDQLIVFPYDALFTKKDIAFTSRMAINISNLLKEEGKLHLVQNPMEGAKYINQYLYTLADCAWNLFNEIEKAGGIATQEGKKVLTTKIATTRQHRINAIKQKEQILVGINNFTNPVDIDNAWDVHQMKSFLSIPQLILEQELA